MDNINDIRKYDPYNELKEFRNDEHFEGKFLEYFEEYRSNVEKMKKMFGNAYDDEIERISIEVVKRRNDEELERIFHEYTLDFNTRTRSSNEKAILRLKQEVRIIKDIILAVEPTDMKRLQKIDEQMGELIDRVSLSLGITADNRSDTAIVSELLESFKTVDVDIYSNASAVLKLVVRDINDYYRRNFSVKTATKYINSLNSRVDKLLDESAIELGILEEDEQLIDDLVARYNEKTLISVSFEQFLSVFKAEIESMKAEFTKKYSNKNAKKLIKLLEDQAGRVIDMAADRVGYPSVHDERLLEIFASYKPEELDIFDVSLYVNEEACERARNEYSLMTDEEKTVFEMRMYEQYIRIFKGKIRELNKEVRRIYSSSYANKMVGLVNKKADKLIRSKAKEIGKPVQKNPWLVRKYLWADTTNFISEDGLKFRKTINPLLRQVVGLAMNNKLIVEERPELDPTKPYIFVSTHYFTEDVIGLFTSLGTQACMLMGTTDQIENNPLMVAAALFGFFHVDRMDSASRSECFEKQNKLIDYGANFINYVSGSWENSENELQPLSFSGPYRTSVLKGVQIVPVASYLVREKKEMYVRYGEPLDLSQVDEKTGNMIIRDTLASMHFKQIAKHSVPIETIYVPEYGYTHNLPYDQHTYYMEQIGREYWNQPWSKPFAQEEIGVRAKKEVTEEEVYAFVDSLSRDKLIELSGTLAEPLRRIDEKDRYDVIKYIDSNYGRFKEESKKRKRVKEK